MRSCGGPATRWHRCTAWIHRAVRGPRPGARRRPGTPLGVDYFQESNYDNGCTRGRLEPPPPTRKAPEMRNWYYRTFKVKAIYANPEIAKGYELRTSPADWWDFDGAATIAPGTMSGVRLAIRYDDITTYHEVWMGDTVQARRRVTPEPKTYTAAQVVEGAAAGAIITVRPTFARPFKI